jgi:hypothetical protein
MYPITASKRKGAIKVSDTPRLKSDVNWATAQPIQDNPYDDYMPDCCCPSCSALRWANDGIYSAPENVSRETFPEVDTSNSGDLDRSNDA